MNADKILQSDVLDIIFENKNKDYGAYNLRKNYNKRLLQAIGVTCLFVMAIVFLQSMKPRRQIAEIPVIIDPILTEVNLQKDEQPKEKEKPKQPKQNIATVNDAPIVVVPNDQVKDTIPTQQTLADNTLGTKNKPGVASTIIDVDPGPPTTGGGEDNVVKPSDPPFDETTIRDWVQHMPEFPGGMPALQKFMLKNLRQPDDIDAGQRIVVRVKFVVNKDGEISDIEVVQSGRNDLDKEVIRVVKKMPRWKPGIQNERPVPVFFNMPVSFVNDEQ